MSAALSVSPPLPGSRSVQGVASSQPVKRSVGAGLSASQLPYLAPFPADGGADDLDKRSSLFRFGKRSSLFRFGKRGSLFRFGKRGSLFRFGKRDGAADLEGLAPEDVEVYPDVYVSDDDVKRAVKSFHWGRESED